VLRNRVSLANLSEDAQTLTETRFLSLRRSGIRNRAPSRPRLLIVIRAASANILIPQHLQILSARDKRIVRHYFIELAAYEYAQNHH